MSLTVVGIVGCSGSGKSTLCDKIAELVQCRIVRGDDYLLSKDKCPPLDLSDLPWPDGNIPAAFLSKRHDTNCPGCVDWPSFESAVEAAIAEESTQPSGNRLLLVESFLLLHSAAILARLNHVITIAIADDDWPSLARRKWERRHLGTASYQERGVSFDAYSVYWTHYVVRRFRECAAGNPARLAGAKAAVLTVDCAAPPEANAHAVLVALKMPVPPAR